MKTTKRRKKTRAVRIVLAILLALALLAYILYYMQMEIDMLAKKINTLNVQYTALQHDYQTLQGAYEIQAAELERLQSAGVESKSSPVVKINGNPIEHKVTGDFKFIDPGLGVGIVVTTVNALFGILSKLSLSY